MLFNTMMLIVLALAAWSATILASVLPTDVTPSTYNYSTLNTTDMRLHNFDDNLGERTSTNTELFDLLLKFHPELQTLSDYELAEKRKLIDVIKKELDDLIKNHHTKPGKPWVKWRSKFYNLYDKQLSEVRVEKAMFEALMHRIKSDHALAIALIKSRNLKPSIFVENMLNSQIKKWKKDNKDEAQVFTLLKLDQENSNPFESPVFSQWVDFLKDNYSKTSFHGPMFDVLANSFGDRLPKILAMEATSKKSHNEKRLAKSLLDQQVEKWSKDENSNGMMVFELLQLNEMNGDLFQNILFPVWVDFLEAKYSKTSFIGPMFDVLAKIIDGDRLPKILVAEALATNFWIQSLARSLLDHQVLKWARDNESVEHVFNILQLDNPNRNLLESPLFLKWANFVKERSPDLEQANRVMLDRLLSRFKSYDALLVALGRRYTTGSAEIAKLLRDYQYKQWEKERESAATVFNILNLQSTKGNLFANPVFSAWVGFVMATSSNEMEASKKMLSILGKNKEQHLKKFLAKRAQTNTVGNKRNQEDPDMEERPPLKRQRSFDLNKALPEINLNLVP